MTGRKGDQLRQELLDAADTILGEQLVLAAPSLRETARRAGVSAPAVYRHFDSQLELITATARRALAELSTTVERSGDPPSVRAYAMATVTWGLAHPGAYQVLFEGRQLLAVDDVDAGISQLQERLVVLVAAERRGGGDSVAHAERLWLALHGLVTTRLRKPEHVWTRTTERETTALVDIFLAT